MKISYRLKRVCGNVYSNGNIIFTPDGNSVISPVGNRVTLFDLVEQSSITLPFENKKNIRRIALSHNGRFLITVDVDGHALFINFPRRVVLHRFHFKTKIHDIHFAPNDEHFAVTHRKGCQVWRTPSVQREFVPLTLSRTISGHHDDVVSLDWSEDSQSIIMGSKDLSARVYYRVHSKNMSMSVLSGHRDTILGVFFSQDSDTAYTVAADGAVFTWNFEYSDRVECSAEQLKRGKNIRARLEDEDSDGGSDSEDEKEEAEEEAAGTEKGVDIKAGKRTRRGGRWNLATREFLWEPHTQVTSCAFNKSSNLLLVGFDKGVFGVYEMPGCVNIHKLSVSHHSLGTAAINKTGEWLAVGSARLGQLLIWEWQSESYVLKQQGHLYGLNSVDYSSDGQLVATAGEDSKVKLWSTSSGFCKVTFSDHVAPVTGVRFVGKGNAKAVVSSSLDGTVRAYDLLRYRNFRTMTAATPVQFTCLAADPSGEIVCAGAMDPFQIYVWALQTGRLVDVLSGHEGPVACLDFSSTGSMLASGSWDGTLKIWDVYKNTCVDTFEHGCDVLSVSFRPDSKAICSCSTNGTIHVWDIESGTQVGTIEGRNDISGGRLTSDAVTAENSARSKHFTTLTYSADGSLILAGGISKYVCIYSVRTGVLLKKFQLSHNRSLEGILDQLNSKYLVDGVAVEALRAGDEDDEFKAATVTPGSDGRRGGAGGGGAGDGSRTTRPQILTAAVRFSSTGREWAAATTQGLQIFSLDDAMLFAPTELDTTVTPQAVATAISREEYGKALLMALQLSLSEVLVVKSAVDAVPIDSIELVVRSLDVRMIRDLIRFLAKELASSCHVEFYLRWAWEVLRFFGTSLQQDDSGSMSQKESLRALLRSISLHEKEALKISEDNMFSLQFLCSQLSRRQLKDRKEAAEAATSAAAAIEEDVVDAGFIQGDSDTGPRDGDEDGALAYFEDSLTVKRRAVESEERSGDVDVDVDYSEHQPTAPTSVKKKKSKKSKLSS